MPGLAYLENFQSFEISLQKSAFPFNACFISFIDVCSPLSTSSYASSHHFNAFLHPYEDLKSQDSVALLLIILINTKKIVFKYELGRTIHKW